MNLIQRFLGTIFPPYRYGIIRREQEKIFAALIHALPDDFADLKQQVNGSRFFGLGNRTLFPEFKAITTFFPGETLSLYQKRGNNYKVSGLQIFSKRQNEFVDAELLIHDNIIVGLRIDKSDYELSEFDTSRINGSNATKSFFEFPASEIDKFIERLEPDIKDKLNPDEVFDIDFGNRTFFAFYDMEDGNYLAVDKHQKVYSLVHDARPVTKQMKVTFKEILIDIREGKFDKEKHLDERYSSTK